MFAEKSTGDSKFDVVLCDEDGVVSRIVVKLMPGLSRSGRLSHAEFVDLMWEVQVMDFESMFTIVKVVR